MHHVARHQAGGLRFHDLRHSYATWLVDDGVPPNMVQRVVGHERSSTTLDLYTRSTDNSVRILQTLDDQADDEDPDDPNLPGHVECMIFSPDDSHRILFIDVPDAKQIRNRVHLDLRPGEGDPGTEELLERALANGAKELWRGNEGPHGWITVADPEGNEICLN